MIRKAQIDDAQQVMRLLHSAIGSIANSLAGTSDDAEAMRILTDFYRMKGNRVSYENVIVDERDGQVAAILLAYDGGMAETLDKPFLERIYRTTGNTNYTIAKESQPGEYYLDSIAVDESYQGQGIGKALLEAFEQKAREAKFSKVSLIVEEQNDRAYMLYKKTGYTEDGTILVSGKLFRRMVKPML